MAIATKTAAKVGDTVNLVELVERGTAVVLPPCEGTHGYWVCSTHREAFRNNLSASIHEDTGIHVSYWACPTHGPEAATT